MKKTIFLFGLAIFTMMACNTAKDESAKCCYAEDKDALEIVMNIPIKIKPEFVSAYKAAFDKCRAETLKEEACKAYDLFQSYTDSTEFHLFEMWTNKAGHQYHMQTAHIKEYFKEIEGMSDPAAKAIITTVCPGVNPAN